MHSNTEDEIDAVYMTLPIFFNNTIEVGDHPSRKAVAAAKDSIDIIHVVTNIAPSLEERP